MGQRRRDSNATVRIVVIENTYIPTVIVNWQLAEFWVSSVAVQVTVLTPIEKVVDSDSASHEMVTDVSKLSLAVGLEKATSVSMVTIFDGQVIDGGVLSVWDRDENVMSNNQIIITSHCFHTSSDKRACQVVKHTINEQFKVIWLNQINLKETSSNILQINTSTKVTCHNFDDLVRQCYWVWGNMTYITV